MAAAGSGGSGQATPAELQARISELQAEIARRRADLAPRVQELRLAREEHEVGCVGVGADSQESLLPLLPATAIGSASTQARLHAAHAALASALAAQALAGQHAERKAAYDASVGQLQARVASLAAEVAAMEQEAAEGDALLSSLQQQLAAWQGHQQKLGGSQGADELVDEWVPGSCGLPVGSVAAAAAGGRNGAGDNLLPHHHRCMAASCTCSHVRDCCVMHPGKGCELTLECCADVPLPAGTGVTSGQLSSAWTG